jgi:uncharacterized protein YjbI with pentapeptide repeats
MGADLSGVSFKDAHLMAANFHEANLTDADLSGSDLTAASLVGTRVENAVFEDCLVHGISAWNLQGEPRIQKNLCITPKGELPIKVNDLEQAQFCNLLAYSRKMPVFMKREPRIGLIMGRFKGGHTEELASIHRELSSSGYLPVFVEVEKPVRKEISKSVSPFLALSRLVFLDVTDLRNANAIVEALAGQVPGLPIVPIVEASSLDNTVTSLPDLDSLLETAQYGGKTKLSRAMVGEWISQAEQKAAELAG